MLYGKNNLLLCGIGDLITSVPQIKMNVILLLTCGQCTSYKI